MFPKPFIQYLYHFHCDRDYFECHEILEEFWKEEDVASRKGYWVAFIQCAVAQYHYRRNNLNGATKMLQNCIRLFAKYEDDVTALGIDYNNLHILLQNQLTAINEGLPYRSIQLPIQDARLLTACQTYAQKRGENWGKESDLSNEFILHKHKLRDRSEVIAERERQKMKRNR
ncbi:DUF309 domain-containing protein [Bacillus kexueae]|uniref:DUF309 domain-containing protein n=1 Tax=Aeribacillus kexueae TaxID=2078952 RepID=UPI001FAF4F87|nr:DUF309 domain-containing protein [Bacillus kexueae]